MAIEIYGSLILTVAPSKDQKSLSCEPKMLKRHPKNKQPDQIRLESIFCQHVVLIHVHGFFSCPVTAIHVQNHHISSHHVRYQCIGSNIVRNHPKSPPSST